MTPFLEQPLELVVPAGCASARWEDLAQLGFIDHPDGKAMARRLAFHSPERIRVVEAGEPVVDTLWLLCRSEWPLSARAPQAA